MVDANGVTANQQNGKLANEILTSACITQGLGVTAGLVGFIYLLLTRPEYHSGWAKFLGLFWPIATAYGIPGLFSCVWLARTNIFDVPWKPRFALGCIYIFFIWFDIILLGFLVHSTGGPRGSIFLPIFLLIPAVATCYCNPRFKNVWFWSAIFAVIAMFALLSYMEFKSNPINANQTQSNSQSSQPTAIMSGIDPNQAHSNVEISQWTARGAAISNAGVSIFCILTAAICYWLTDVVRRKPRSGSGKDCHPDTCKPFYL